MAVYDYIVNALSGNSVRVFFAEEVLEQDALDISRYYFNAITPGAYLPRIIKITPFSSDRRQYQITFDRDLTHSSIYSFIIKKMPSIEGNKIRSSAHNFNTYSLSGPVLLGAFLSVRGCVDLVFDRSVGPYSASASVDLCSSTNQVSMTQVSWDSSIPENNLRFTVPATIDPDQNWYVNASSVYDISTNYITSGVVYLSVPNSVPRPLTFAQVNQLQVIDSFITNWEREQNVINVRVFFNFALSSRSASDPLNYLAYQINTHPTPDDYFYVTSGPAFDLTSLITVLNDLKSKFSSHVKAPQVHLSNSLSLVLPPDASDATSAAVLLNGLIQEYESHRLSEDLHNSKDPANVAPFGIATSSDIPGMLSLTNTLVASYNRHIGVAYQLNLTSFGLVPEITSTGSLESNRVDSDFVWYVDLRYNSLSPKSQIVVGCTVESSDGLSTTSIFDYTGVTFPRPADHRASPIGHSYKSHTSLVLKTDSDISLPLDEVEISKPGGFPFTRRARVSTSFPAAFWALQESWIQYDNHRVIQSHLNTDAYNTVDLSDLPTESTFIDSVNLLLTKFNSHRTGSLFHGLSDSYPLPLVPATDIESATVLLVLIRQAINAHTMNPGLHVGSSEAWLSAPNFDSVHLDTGCLKIGELYNFSFKVMKSAEYLTQPSGFSIDSDIIYNFSSVGYMPSVASVVPLNAVSVFNTTPGFTSDSVEIFFDKPMDTLSISGLNITGSGIFIQDKRWISDFSAKINVANMRNTSYSLEALVTDIAGNQVAT